MQSHSSNVTVVLYRPTAEIPMAGAPGGFGCTVVTGTREVTGSTVVAMMSVWPATAVAARTGRMFCSCIFFYFGRVLSRPKQKGESVNGEYKRKNQGGIVFKNERDR